MRCGGRMVGCLAGCYCVVVLSGCVSLNDYRKVQAAHRNLTAENQALAQELFDARNNNDSLRTRVDSLSRELTTGEELLANLRKENELLDEIRQRAQAELERWADRPLGGIAIAGPKLPEPLHQALERFAGEHPTLVTYDAVRGTVKWKADLLFAIGSDVVKQSSIEALRRFTQVVTSPVAAGFEVLVVGHTDTRAIARSETKKKHPTNWHLSAHRAIAVSFAMQKHGYTAERIGVMGCGEYRPIADNTTEAGSSQNRRVEIYLVPQGSIVRALSNVGRSDDGKTLATARPQQP